jgi:hypothetical protein
LSEASPVDELNALLDEIEVLAPTRKAAEPTAVMLRSTEDDVIDDTLPPEAPLELEFRPQQLELSYPADEEAPVSDFRLTGFVPVAAVDCGIARLGETENGLVIALRATVVIDIPTGCRIQLFRTGPIYLHNLKKAELLLRVGMHLGRPDLFVELAQPEEEAELEESIGRKDVGPFGEPVVERVRPGVADDSHKYGDRFRNWLERLVQRVAASSIQNGIVLLDGALTLRTIDTPQEYLEDLADEASSNGNALIAVSKQSMLQIRGRPLPFWLNDVPQRACYRLLSNVMAKEANERVLGNAYAVRFSPLGHTFRMDVRAVDGQTDDEAIYRAYSSLMMRSGYPDILVRAHAHSYFTSPDVIQLQAQANRIYDLVPQPEASLTGIFAPFGGRFK